MIVATAGHVDHGKTRLVEALTGVDTDRLAEEKRRGLSIDIGFAYLPREIPPDIGFIDVPGHERFVRNALCGLAATDFVLLVVAADDGPMPQTREHLAIVDLLGCKRGAIALTKIDRVDAARITEIEARITALTSGAGLSGLPVFRVSAITGTGIEALRKYLQSMTDSDRQPADASRNFRLAVDRCFEVRGAGTVVTGTVFSGILDADDEVRLGGSDTRLRVRELRVHDAPAQRACAGQRCALNLAGPGLRRRPIRRGDWITSPAAPPPVTRFDARLRLCAETPRPLRHWTPVHLHLAATETIARIAVLERAPIIPGNSGLVQIVADAPLGAAFGDRFIVRDQSARNTLGGGRVLDIHAPRRGRAKPARIAWLEALDRDPPVASLEALLASHTAGVDLDAFAANRNLAPAAADKLFGAVEMTQVEAGGVRYAFDPRTWQAHAAQALATLQGQAGGGKAVEMATLRRLADIDLPSDRFSALVEELRRQSRLRIDGSGIRLADDEDLAGDACWQSIDAALTRAGMKPLTPAELGHETGITAAHLNQILARARQAGRVIRLSRDLLLRPDSLRGIGAIIDRLAAANPDQGFSVAAFRNATGIGRNRCIELLEVLDARKITAREGNTRHLLAPAEQALDRMITAGN